MKISIIMIDGAFRENIFGAEYFTKQDFPTDDFEVIWVEFHERANEELYKNDRLKVITLGYPKNTVYHSSLCFNEGIQQAKGELLIIPDADVIVEPDFLQKAWAVHQENEKLVAYGYRCNEVKDAPLNSLDFAELERKCVITNPINYGGCLSVRKKWLMAINGYDQTEILATGFHANGQDIYTRFRNFGMPIQWELSLKLYHPKHAFTSEKAPQYERQRQLIEWRSENLEYLPLKGIDPNRNTKSMFQEKKSSNRFFQKMKKRLPFNFVIYRFFFPI